MKRLFKTIFAICITITLGGILAGCGAQKTPALSDIEASMKQKVGFKDMVKIDNDKIQRIYGINSSDIESSFVYISSSNVKADEVAVIKVKDLNKVSEVEDKISKRIEKQSNSFKDYVPDQYDLVQNNLLKNNSKYILFIVSQNKDKYEEIFDAAFK